MERRLRDTEYGGVISVEFETAGDSVIIRAGDNGAGIREDIIERIFSRISLQRARRAGPA